MGKADAVGNTRRIFNLVKMLSNKPKAPPTNLTSDNLLRSSEDIAKTWEKFLSQNSRQPKKNFGAQICLL